MLENLSLWFASFVLWAGEQSPEYWAFVTLAGLVTGGLTWLGLRAWGARGTGATTEFDSVTDRPACSRREDLDEVVAGRMEWDTYVARHRGLPGDGSLRAERPKRPTQVRVWFPIERTITFDQWDVTKSPACTQNSHTGQRISRARVRYSKRNDLGAPPWKMEIFQPSLREWVTPHEIEIATHKCCEADYVWVVQLNGKPVA